MNNPTCPYCQTEIAYDVSLAGEFATCPQCGGSFYMPHAPQAARPVGDGGPVGAEGVVFDSPIGSNPFAENTHSGRFAGAPDYTANEPPLLIMIPIVLSAIWNLVMGMVYISTCIGIIIGGPMMILALSELQTYSNARAMRRRELADRAQLLGVLEIVAGLFNGAGIVFGVLTLVGASQIGRRRNTFL